MHQYEVVIARSARKELERMDDWLAHRIAGILRRWRNSRAHRDVANYRDRQTCGEYVWEIIG